VRHAYATDLLSQGGRLKVARERLGHSKIAITLDLPIYEIVSLAVSSKQAPKGKVRRITLPHRGG
jgi:site-specific recombinase XerD